MTWMSIVAQRRIKIAHRCERWAQQAEQRNKTDRAARFREIAAHHSRVAYSIEESYRKYKILQPAGAA